MRYFIFLIIIYIILNSCAETNPKNDLNKISSFETKIREFPTIKDSSKYQVLTLGVFHFDRSMDGSDVVAKNHIDISTPTNQACLDSLLNLLKKFNPTQIAVEWKPNYQSYLDSLYSVYRNGTYTLGKNETFQLGFKLASQLNLDKIFCIDNNPPLPETVNSIDDWDKYAEELGHSDLWHKYDGENERYLTYMDTIQNSLNVLEYLKIINSPINVERSKQLWTTGLVNLGHGDKYIGADLLGRWYRRNVRIFVNAKNLVSKKDERLLIIYGGAHKWILDELFTSSPEFEVVQLNELLR